ncbi:MAG: N-6 DNA methylase [Candidatus Sericytochromatia bacterium]|nr:N-6 DNA methylase [Candidatus Sericytochromatia bacterium]
MSTNNIGSALQAYESQIWATAETLYSNGFKASEWPKYMMPFFALMLVESRIVRAKNEKIKEIEVELGCTFNPLSEIHVDYLNEAVLHQNYGYHPDLIKFNRPLSVICDTQPSNFYSRLMEYLSKYDEETKKLLGIGYAEGTAKHLDLQGIIGSLNAKSHGSIDVLYNFTKKWAQIDLSIFNNSEVTTIEEHIKHKWADISAETAGEHYTPFDVIELCTDINIAIAPIEPEGSWEVYDMTCGGGNFVFGLEDALRKIYPKLSVESYGQEYNDQLYALGAIESRFRQSAQIEYGNTLTNDRFTGQLFGSVIGNPPYGTEWKEFYDSIQKDKTGRFSADKMPPISDSQMLFLQHAVSHMKPNGVGSIVHNGSPLTSGDAGGGESNIRKYLLKEIDVVHAIIQLPQNIFFNTGISTYVWVLNKNKPAHLKGKVMIINAETMFTKLKKSLNKKSCGIDKANRKIIIDTLKAGVDSEICKVLSVDLLMYNKVELEITRLDENGNSVKEIKKLDKNGKEVSVIEKVSDITEVKISSLDSTDELILSVSDELIITNEEVATLKQKITEAETIKIVSGKDTYLYFNEENIVEKNGLSLGKGVITFKVTKPKKAEENQFKVEVSISPLKEKDSETTPFESDKEKNEKIISEFLNKWIKEPYIISEHKTGCEINFNKTFPKKIEMRLSSYILAEMDALDKEFGDI